MSIWIERGRDQEFCLELTELESPFTMTEGKSNRLNYTRPPSLYSMNPSLLSRKHVLGITLSEISHTEEDTDMASRTNSKTSQTCRHRTDGIGNRRKESKRYKLPITKYTASREVPGTKCDSSYEYCTVYLQLLRVNHHKKKTVTM